MGGVEEALLSRAGKERPLSKGGAASSCFKLGLITPVQAQEGEKEWVGVWGWGARRLGGHGPRYTIYDIPPAPKKGGGCLHTRQIHGTVELEAHSMESPLRGPGPKCHRRRRWRRGCRDRSFAVCCEGGRGGGEEVEVPLECF